MKMRTLFALMIALVIGAGAMSAGTYDHSIGIDPLDLLIGKKLSVTYEQKTSPDNSFTVFGSYYKLDKYWSAFGIGASYRWYLDIGHQNKTPLEGLSVGPIATISFWSWDDPDNLRNNNYDGGSYIAIGGEASYKFVFDQFVVEPNIKLMFGVSDITGLGYDPYGLGINLGYAW